MSLTYKGGRLAVLACSFAATVFFLIFAQLQIPGGANAFTEWADLIAFGGKADPGLSQRDVGYPLLLVLSGYPYTQSFVGITVINAVFAILTPLMVYATIGRAHPALALVTALAVILSSTPYGFMKFIHHDHAYLFFQMLCVYCGVSFLRRRESWRVYAMTAAGLAASLCRPSGNLLLVFVFIFVLVVETRRAWKHILVCAAFAVLVLGTYADYRNRIGLDGSQDSYFGRQLFYNPYVNSRAFGIRLGPDTGPAMSRLIDALREGLREKPPGSKEFDDWLVSQSIPREAAAVYFDGRSADEIVNRVLTHPHYDFFELLCFYEPDDSVFRAAAIEIMAQHPFAVLGYTLRNMVLFVASDGYAHGRYGLDEDAGIRRGGTYSPWFRWLTNDLWPV